MSCPTASLCVAVDLFGNTLTSTNPTGGASSWTLHKVTSYGNGEVEGITAVGCPTTGLCFASFAGVPYESKDPSSPSATWAPVSSNPPSLSSVACATTLCATVNATGHVQTTTDPLGGVPSWSGSLIDPGQ